MGCCNSKSKADKKKSYLLETLEGHEAGINCMALSEDGSVLATGSEDKTARLWSTKTSKSECIGILRGHEEYINCILIEDCFVLTGSADKTVRKWDVSTCECVLIMRGHTSVIYRMICTGDFIFTSSYDRTARCWDFDMGECIRVFRGHKRGVYPLIFIPGDDDEAAEDTFDASDATKDMLITGSADFTARTWNFETGQCLKVFKGHTGAITCMATDTMGRVLFTGSTDNSIRSWNLLKGEQLKLFSGHQGSVICMQVINKILYSGSSDHTGRAWVTEFGDCTRIYKGHKHTRLSSYLASAENVRDHLLPAETIVHEKWLPAENVRVILLPAETLGRKLNHTDGLCRKLLPSTTLSAGSKTSRTVSTEDKYDGQSLQEPKISGHVYTLCVVDGKLFTGSYDGCVKVWDITGINDDTTFGNEEEEKKKGKDVNNDIEKMGNLDKVDKNQNGIHSNGQEKIMID